MGTDDGHIATTTRLCLAIALVPSYSEGYSEGVQTAFRKKRQNLQILAVETLPNGMRLGLRNFLFKRRQP